MFLSFCFFDVFFSTEEPEVVGDLGGTRGLVSTWDFLVFLLLPIPRPTRPKKREEEQMSHSFHKTLLNPSGVESAVRANFINDRETNLVLSCSNTLRIYTLREETV